MSDERAQRIEAILGDIIGRRRTGDAVHYSEYEARHPELMPELGARLARFRAIEAAAHVAQDCCAAAPSDDADIEFLRSSLTDYEVHERINYGGQGVVYRALQKSTHRIVAIKVLLDGPLAGKRQRDRFAREVELLARLHHPNVVTIHESGEVAGRPYLVMEYVDGMPIDDYVLLHELSVPAIVGLFRRVCLAVAAAHQRGVLHRDLKPANILVDDVGQPHVLDFGLAKDLEGSDDFALSLSGQVVGTLPYLSPEQAGGSNAASDVRSDIYTLGVLLYELLIGEYPYSLDGERAAVVQRIMSAEPRRLRRRSGSDGSQTPRIDTDLEGIVLKALEKEPARRYQSASALAEDLERFLAGDVVEARAHSGWYLLHKTLRRYRTQVLVATAVLGLVMASLAGMVVLWLRAERIGRIAQSGLNMHSSINEGSVQRDAGRLDVAVEMFQRAVRIGEEIETDDPTVMRNLFLAYHRLATLYDTDKRHEEGREYVTRTVEVARKMLESPELKEKARRDYSFAVNLLGRYAWCDKDWAKALGHHQECTAIREALLRDDPENSTLRKDLADSYRGEARSLRKLERMDEALARLSSARQLLSSVVASEPQVVDHEIELARIEAETAVFYMTLKTLEGDKEALVLLDGVLARLGRLHDDPRARGRQWDIAGLTQDHEKNRQITLRRLARHGSGVTSPPSTGTSSPSATGSEAPDRVN